jgi:hypothetical protein
VDGSTMKLQLRDDKIDLETDYGKLRIPVADIKRIDFAQRIADDTRKRIAEAIHDLSSADFRRRDAAGKLLLSLKDKAYPALAHARARDAETGQRIEQLLEKLREICPAEALDLPIHDTVHTAHSRIAGRIKVESIRVTTLPFGDQAVKLADIRSLRSGGFEDEPAAVVGNILPDPGTLGMYANQVGKTLAFRVTAPPAQLAAQMGVWGTDVYTVDSSLAASALHAGVLRPGETGVVRVTLVGQHVGFQASLRNGVMSNPNGMYAGFRIEQSKRAPRPKN